MNSDAGARSELPRATLRTQNPPRVLRAWIWNEIGVVGMMALYSKGGRVA